MQSQVDALLIGLPGKGWGKSHYRVTFLRIFAYYRPFSIGGLVVVAGYEDCISYMHSGMANNLRIFSMLRKLICVCACKCA